MMGSMSDVEPSANPELKPLTIPVAFGRALRLRCPVCGGGGLFRWWFQMAERCPTCGLRFERIEGHWLGSLAVNSVSSFGLLLLVLVIAFVATYPDPSVPFLLTVTMGAAIFLPPFLFPFSRTTWTAADLLARPLTPDDMVDPRYWPPRRPPRHRPPSPPGLRSGPPPGPRSSDR